MTIIHARKMRIYPTDIQKQKINITLGHSRFIYNKMLERNKTVYARRGGHLNYYAMQNLLPEMKSYYPWLKEADSQALQQACKDLNTAYDKFFHKQAGFPKFHSRKGRQSYRTTQTRSMAVKQNRVKVPCLGWVESSDKRDWGNDYHICYETISRETDGRYYVSVTYKYETADTETRIYGKALGLDYKSDGLYADSEGNIADMPHYFRQSQKQLKRLQRQLSKRQGYRKGEKQSNNFKKLLKRIGRLQSHIVNQRKDYLQKLSTEITNQYDVICIEDLDMRAMANKSFGNGKATNDNGYGMFVAMLGYKLFERGKHLIKVDRWYPSSQLCQCGYKNPVTRDLSVRKIICPVCGRTYDRDFNAAINIRNEGLRLLRQQSAA